MKFRKDKWKEVALENHCEFVRGPFGGLLKKEIFVDEGFAIYEQQHAINNQFEEFRYFVDKSKYNEMRRFQIAAGDIIMSCSGTFGKIAVIPKKSRPGIINQALLKLRCKPELNTAFFSIWLNSPAFQEKINESVQGTAIKNIASVSFYKQIKIPLPPLEEQQQIAALFQSIDAAIEQVEGQENNLKALRKSLVNKLTKQNPLFGNLITQSNCKEYLFGDLVVEVPDRTDNPQNSGFEKFIGLEDFESGELIIQRFSSTEKLVSAMKLCKKGDVLFARRNVYLKRASITEFDAVCSGDVIVMRANEKIILPKFLILVMNTDEFWDYTISNAAGTMSKRVKWRDLATYSLELPNLKIQSKILEIFGHLETTLSQLKQQKTTLQHLKQKLLSEILG